MCFSCCVCVFFCFVCSVVGWVVASVILLVCIIIFGYLVSLLPLVSRSAILTVIFIFFPECVQFKYCIHWEKTERKKIRNAKNRQYVSESVCEKRNDWDRRWPLFSAVPFFLLSLLCVIAFSSHHRIVIMNIHFHCYYFFLLLCCQSLVVSLGAVIVIIPISFRCVEKWFFFLFFLHPLSLSSSISSLIRCFYFLLIQFFLLHKVSL